MAGVENDPEAERKRRLDALRDLARDVDQGQRSAPPVSPSLTPVASVSLPAARARRRTWLYVGMASLLIVAVLAGGAWVALGARGAKSLKTTRSLTPFVITALASAGVYCPSQPAWSPDGKYLAVMATTNQPGDAGWCLSYNDLVSNYATQVDRNYSGSFAWGTVALILDAKTGDLVRRLQPLDPTSALCKGANDCGFAPIQPASLSWSPDGASVCIFATLDVFLTGAHGLTYSQYRGALEVMRADGTGHPQLLVAHGRAMIADNQNLAVNLYSPPLFTWNLAAGSATYTDIHEAAGLETVNYAPAFQVGPTAELTPLTAASTAVGSISPWSYGVVYINGGDTGSLPQELFHSSGWAWSHDGRYVTPDVNTMAYMNVQTVTSKAPPNIPGAYSPPFVAPPDLAAAAVVSEIAPRNAVAYVARDPSGDRLASFSCQPDGDTGKLIIRATPSGAVLATTLYRFPTLASSFGCPGDAEALNWSPDGSRLTMTDTQDSQVIIWPAPAKS